MSICSADEDFAMKTATNITYSIYCWAANCYFAYREMSGRDTKFSDISQIERSRNPYSYFTLHYTFMVYYAYGIHDHGILCLWYTRWYGVHDYGIHDYCMIYYHILSPINSCIASKSLSDTCPVIKRFDRIKRQIRPITSTPSISSSVYIKVSMYIIQIMIFLVSGVASVDDWGGDNNSF